MMKKIKVLHIYKSYYPDTQGGVERLIQMLSHETDAMGCENRLLTCTSKKKAYSKKDNALAIYYYPKTIELASSPFSYSLWKAFPQHIQWADIIHYHFPWPMADLLHYSRRIKKPSIVTYHSDVVKQKYLKYLYQPLMHYFLKKMDRIVSTSQNYADTSVPLKNYAEKIRVIPIGIDPEYYQVKPEKQKIWREKLPESFILFVGVLRYYKGLEYLLKAIDGLSVSLVIVGNGPLLETLREQAKNIKVAKIVFTGMLNDEDLGAVYSLAKALIIPASHRSEAYCIALVEGLLFGLPLISTEIGTGTSFVNQQNKTGLIVPPCHPEKLREAIAFLLSDDALQKRFGEASRERFNTFFTAELMAKAYVSEYKMLITSR